MLLAACRFGAEPGALASIVSLRRLSLSDWLLIGAFSLCPFVAILGFRPEIELWLDPGALPLLILFGVAGASPIRWRGLLALVAVGVTAYWLLAPFRPYGGLENYLDYRFGIPLGDGFEYCLAFVAGRVLARRPAVGLTGVSIAFFAWILMFSIAVTVIQLRLPYGSFGQDSATLLSQTPISPTYLDFDNLILVSPELLFIQTIIVWRLAATATSLLGKGLKAAIALGALAVAMAAISLVVQYTPFLPIDQGESWGWSSNTLEM